MNFYWKYGGVCIELMPIEREMKNFQKYAAHWEEVFLQTINKFFGNSQDQTTI